MPSWQAVRETGTETTRPMYKMPFADFDPARFMADFKIPAFDAEGAMALHRKNVEAMTAAGQTAFEGAGAFMRRQGELAREAVEASAANMNVFFGDVASRTRRSAVRRSPGAPGTPRSRAPGNLRTCRPGPAARCSA